VSTTTTTAMGELQKRLPPSIGKIYYPFDHSSSVARALNTIHPNAIILVESEIWPNFIWRARALGKPLFLVNARLSDRSYPRFKKFGFLFKNLFGAFTSVGAQNEDDAAKLRELGCAAEAVRVVGNLKFDAAKPVGNHPLDVAGLLKQLGVSADAPLWVAGSTHPGEERILAGQFQRLRTQFPDLVFILVPRHNERAREVGQELSELGIKYVYRSEIAPDTQRHAGSVQCLLVDTIGELRYFYEHATVVFVGKSLVAEGGQNPIEPAALGKPVVFGPNMQNFTDVTKNFLAQGGAIQVRDADELEKTIADLLGNPKRRAQLGCNAQRIVQENQGAVERTVEMILENLKDREFYIVPSSK
ncbi:MAG TPA: 3-deoxy-D-manno-octulosonic acid transferase, partial [Verrucomicrobiae bacterium]|nr:3-deoxy-D-manno-octulosonic acid transferase [Verrucomicrobiae bacterium]